jgi:hypothetical protein
MPGAIFAIPFLWDGIGKNNHPVSAASFGFV